MAEGTTGSPARGSAAPPSGGLPTGFIVVAVLLAFAGADVFSTFKGATQISDSVASAPVDRHSLGGKVHISFCQS